MSQLEHTAGAVALPEPDASAGPHARAPRHLSSSALQEPSWLAPVLLVVVWEALAQDGYLSPQVLPAPSKILRTAYKLTTQGSLLNDLGVSLLRAVAGFAIGGAVAFAVGILVGFSQLAEADANVAHILRNHFSVVERLVRNPRGDQAREWQKAVANGAIIGLATTELDSPQAGNITPSTTFTPDGDDYLLNGTKYYSTGTIYSDLVLVRAADPAGRPGATIIPLDRAGIELIDDWDGMGQRLTGTTHFRNVRVKREEIVFDAPDIGYGVPYSNTFAQLFLTAAVAGIGRAALRDAVALVSSRRRTFYYAPHEKPTEDPLLQQTIGKIASAAHAAETVVLVAAEALDAATAAFDSGRADADALAHRAALLSAQAIVADDAAIRNGGLIFDVGGSSSTKKATNLDRHWRNARTLSSHNPVT